jgi:hypothetical protein
MLLRDKTKRGRPNKKGRARKRRLLEKATPIFGFKATPMRGLMQEIDRSLATTEKLMRSSL